MPVVAEKINKNSKINKNGRKTGKKQIRFGAYYPAESFVHSLDPRAKIVAMLLFLTGILFVDSYAWFAVVYAFGMTALCLAHIPIARAFGAVRGLVVLLVFTALINAFFTPGETVLWEYGALTLTLEGLHRSLLMLLRLVAMVAFSGLLTFTTTPIALSDGLEYMGRPFVRFGFPAHEFAMMMTIALRFIPVLLEEADKIMKAQRSRGGDWREGSISRRVKGIVAVIVPLLFNALKRADDLAIAMEARGYIGGEGRVSLRELKWRGTDTAAVLTVVVLVVLLVASRWLPIWAVGF